MKQKILLGLSTVICVCAAALLVLTGCSKSQGQSRSQPSSQSEPMSQAESMPGVLPGVSAENYPRVDGSTANMPLMAQVYSKICSIPIEEAESLISASGGTGAVWRTMMWESADLLIVYEAPENIKAEMEAQNLKLEINPIGRDGLVFLVNSQNRVDNLTTEQLQDIYTGHITDWSEVGGAPGPISPFQRNAESGSQTLFLKLLMGDTTPMTPPTELIPGSMAGLIEAVAAYDGSGGAIGYSVYYYANQMYANPDIKLLSLDGIAPSFETIKNGQYPLVNDFYVVIRADEPQDSAARLLRDWLLTDEGTELLVATNYVPIR